MLRGWAYRVVSAIGVIALTVIALLIANHPFSQELFTTYIPVFDRLEVTVMERTSLYWALTLTVLAVLVSLFPLYKPRPRRKLDVIALSHQRVIIAGLALATLGYFKWSHRLPRATLVMTIGILSVTIPLWFLWIRRDGATDNERTLLVGDDLEQLERIADAVEGRIFGYLCPTSTLDAIDVSPDGGVIMPEDDVSRPDDLEKVLAGIDRFGRLGALDHLGGLSRLEDILINHDIDTVVLAFRKADRGEFFGALNVCHDHGVAVKVHRRYADSVLVAPGAVGDLVDVDIEPWDPFDHMLKRTFDVIFAIVGLVIWILPMAVIAIAIKLDDGGPILYKQERTSGFGEPFPVYKFRSMTPDGDSPEPVEDEENDRITRVGRYLRRTHLDELPQLWYILIGHMSAVGPRAAWTDEEMILEEDSPAWRKRWFVKPGLTGLAQINDVKSTEPAEKLRYDLEYIRRQSIWFDIKIVIRQVWKVLSEIRSVDDDS